MTTENMRWLEEAYSEGQARGRAIMAGGVGSTRVGGTQGQHYRDLAAEAAKSLGWPAEELIRRVTAFHAERLEALPDPARYPEIRAERELLLRRYQGMRDAGMTAELVALVESLAFWQSYGFPAQTGQTVYQAARKAASRERCRVVYLPQSDRGALHMKNVDDPLETWIPDSPISNPGRWPHSPLFFDGVGNGLHMDEIPPEIFPADARAMVVRYCATVPEATDFLSRYNYFWGSQNLLVHDDRGNSVAFDKASRCRFAVRRPGPGGINFVNGMCSFDPDYEDFIGRQRRLYLKQTGKTEDSLDGRYWAVCRNVARNMTRYMEELAANPTQDKLIDVMTRRDPDGPMCKPGVRTHPDDAVREATLIQQFYLLDEKTLWRRQWRGETPVWQDPWEIIHYS